MRGASSATAAAAGSNARARPLPATSTSGIRCGDRGANGGRASRSDRRATGDGDDALCPSAGTGRCPAPPRLTAAACDVRMHVRLRQEAAAACIATASKATESEARSTPKEAHCVSRGSATIRPKLGQAKDAAGARRPHAESGRRAPGNAVSQSVFRRQIGVPRLLNAYKFGNLASDFAPGDWNAQVDFRHAALAAGCGSRAGLSFCHRAPPRPRSRAASPSRDEVRESVVRIEVEHAPGHAPGHRLHHQRQPHHRHQQPRHRRRQGDLGDVPRQRQADSHAGA